MIGFIVRRLLQSVGVMLAVAFIAFAATDYIGDPVGSLLGVEATLQDRERLTAELGLGDPLPVRFARFVSRAAQGDFGRSYRVAEPVAPMILSRLPATAELAVAAALLALVFGIPMGLYAGLRPGTPLTQLLMSISLVGVSLPTFLVAILLILIFSVTLGWLPSFGRGEVVTVGGWTTGLLTWSGLKALILPAITLGLFQMTLIMRLVRSEILEVLRADYIRFARARGLSDRAIHFGHALRNTLVPVVTVTGLQFGSIVAFAVITETVFAWPGMGQLFLQSVQAADIPAIAAYLVFVALVFVVINLIVDLTYYAIDPRVRFGVRAQS